MGEAVEQRRRHLRVAEDPGPFAEAEICRDDDTRALVEFTEQMEQQRPARGAERQVAELVEDDEIRIYSVVSKTRKTKVLSRGVWKFWVA